jgi:hypothetical protein
MEEVCAMCAEPTRQETARSKARERYRDEWRRTDRRAEQDRLASQPRGNQRPDQHDVDRGVERLWAVVGR